MEAAIVEILRPIAKILTDHLTRKLRYLISYKKYLKEMRDKIEVLSKKRDEVKEHIDKYNIMDSETPQDVKNWLVDVEAVIAQAVEAIPSDNIGCPDIKMRYGVGLKAFNAAKMIGDHINKNPGTLWDRIRIPHGHVESSTSALTPSPSSGGKTKSDYDSRDKPFKEALKFLRDNTTQVIALCGMGGVGKTTMMERLRKDADDKKMFNQIVKAVIGRERNMLLLQNDIADYTGGPLTELGVTARAKSLSERFENMLKAGKSILVILDDVWEKIELKNIGLASPLPNGVKLLLTSRNENICKMIAADILSVIEVVKVQVLVQAEARNLFFRTTKVSEEDRDRYEIGCCIVKKCGVLPLAIKLIAATLIGKDKHVWGTTLDCLMHKDLSDDLKEIIEVSYKALREEEREILLLCGLHPEDSNIPIEDLTRYAWGLRLFKRVPTFGYARGKTETCVSNLKSANLLMDGDNDKSGCVKMHDLVLAFVVDTVSKGDDAWIIDHSDESNWLEVGRSESCKRISLSCANRSEFPPDFKFPNLSVLKLSHGRYSLKFPLDFYEEMKNLEFIGYDRMVFPLLPTSFQNAPYLRSLCLHGCWLPIDYSCIGNLSNLEVLSFAMSDVRKLPSTFRNLTKLRLLDLTNCRNLVIDDGVLGNLGRLEELYMRSYSGIRFTNCSYEELAILSKNLSALEIEFFNKDALPQNMLFEKLKRFKISVGRPSLKDVKFLLWKSDTGSYENTLILVTNKDRLLESRMNELFRETKLLYLEIQSMKNLQDVNVHPPTRNSSFHNLRFLVVSECGNLEHLFTLTVATTLRNLEALVISKCPLMEAIIDTEDNGAETITFPKLRSLLLFALPKLSWLCNNVNIIKLPHLVKLVLSDLPKITHIYHKNEEFATSSNISTKKHFFNEQVDIHEHEELYISDMENLEEIWPREYNVDSRLRSIEVKSCERLVNLFPSNPMRLLGHLEELVIENCSSIETLFDINMDKVSEIEDGNSVLRRIEVRRCEGLVSLFPINSMPLLSCLEEIEVVNCASIKKLFNIDMDRVSDMDDGSSVLKRITVINCDSLESLFPSNPMSLLHRLEELIVEDCASIETLFNIDWDRISNVEDCSSTLRRIDVSNLGKLREIWRVKGLNTGNILISGFQVVERIIIKHCKSFENVFKLVNSNFNMGALMDIEIYESGEFKKSTRELEIDVAFPSCFMHNFHHLQKIGLHDVEGVEVVFEIESGSSKESSKTQSQLLLPNLTTIKLTCMEKMTHVWKCNWNERLIFQKQPDFPFQRLTTINMYRCNKIEYLFSPLMVKLLSNLKKIDIQYCLRLEDVVSNMDDINDEEMPNIPPPSSSSTQTITSFFPFLDSLFLWELSSLKRIGGGGATTTPTSIKVFQVVVIPWSLCQYSRKISIRSCDKLSSVIPYFALGQMQRLEQLEIEYCDSMIEVFETEGINNIVVGNVAKGSSGTHPTLESPRLKNMYVPQLTHLKEIKIVSCDLLQHVFTFSALESLKQLEKLKINECKAMKAIVKEDHGEQTKKDVVFPRLKSIKLVNLPNLEGFFLGMNDFQWKSLELVVIDNCPGIRFFTTGQSTALKLNFIRTSLGKHRLEHDLNFHVTTYLDQTQFPSLSLCPTATSQGKPAWPFHNIIEIDVTGQHDIKHIIPCNKLRRLQKLEKIQVNCCDLVEELFEMGLEGSGLNETSCSAVEIPDLREMELKLLYNLKCIWKSNQQAVL